MSARDEVTGPPSPQVSGSDGITLTIGDDDGSSRRRWLKRTWLAMLVIAVAAVGVLGATEISSLRDDVSAAAAEVTVLRDENEDLRQVTGELRQENEFILGAVAALQNELQPGPGVSLESRIEQMEDALFGFSGTPSYASGYIFDLEDSIYDLDASVNRIQDCVDSLVDAWRFGNSYVFC
jgi:cell division protein FtsB